MKNLAILLTTAALLACSQGTRPGTTSVPGQGAITVAVEPNPIVANRVSGNTYDFPFEVSVRETGGRPVSITRVSATVVGPAGIELANESWDAQRIRSMGYGTDVGARGEIRYRFNPRKEVPDDRLFGSVAAELEVEGRDDGGSPVRATTVVTIRR
jgi:hypothetical protein